MATFTCGIPLSVPSTLWRHMHEQAPIATSDICWNER